MTQDIEKRLTAIEQRNENVTFDKAWETSFTRRITIALITYAVAALLMMTLNVPNWSVSALIPVCGYILSTLSLPFLKKWWISQYKRDARN
jgi:uncharacterized protein (DUF983 family)